MYKLLFCSLLALCSNATIAQTNTPSPDICQNAPPLPQIAESDPGKTVVTVNTETELRTAMSNLQPNTVVLIAPGIYKLQNTIVVKHDNVTIRGDSNRCDAVRLQGMGMENAAGRNAVPHGIWTNADNTKVQNLSIEDVFNHSISVDSKAQSPHIYNVLLLNSGEQFVKVNHAESTVGSRNGRLEYSVMKFTDGIPLTDHGGGIGVVQGIQIQSGNDWVIANNRFENFHTPDNADFLWNPAVLVWKSSTDTIVENNIFINVDRAIAFGLSDRDDEHTRGIIRNNMIVMSKNLFSKSRKKNADAPIIVWSSPDSQVLHNTVLTNGNTPYAIELRFTSNGTVIRNNLIDAPIRDRSSNQYVEIDNIVFSDPTVFVDPDNGDLHLRSKIEGISNTVNTIRGAPLDIDGQIRLATTTDVGADEFKAK